MINGKYLYECPLGLSYITAAVSGGQGKLLRLTAGPFLMEDKQDFEEFDLPKLKDLSASDIRNVMSRIDPVPVADPKKVNAFSQLLVYSAARNVKLSFSGKMERDSFVYRKPFAAFDLAVKELREIFTLFVYYPYNRCFFAAFVLNKHVAGEVDFYISSIVIR